MNVALSRARTSLWVVCNESTMRQSPPWDAFCTYARRHGMAFDIDDVHAPLLRLSSLPNPVLVQATATTTTTSTSTSRRRRPRRMSYDIEGEVNDVHVVASLGSSDDDEEEDDDSAVVHIKSISAEEIRAARYNEAIRKGELIDLSLEDGEIV